MGRSLSIVAKERWRKRKAVMEASQNEADGPNHSALTIDNEPSKHSQSAAFSSKRKTSKANNTVVRRSVRVKSLGSFGKRQGRQSVHHIDLTNCERDGELHVEPISLEPINDVSSSEMKVDYLVHTRGKRPFASETTLTNLNYKILCTDSYKKIEALTEENYRQAQKLYYMLGKVKIYENMIGIVMNSSHGAIKLHPDAATPNSAPVPKSSPVKKNINSVKRTKKN